MSSEGQTLQCATDQLHALDMLCREFMALRACMVRPAVWLAMQCSNYRFPQRSRCCLIHRLTKDDSGLVGSGDKESADCIECWTQISCVTSTASSRRR